MRSASESLSAFAKLQPPAVANRPLGLPHVSRWLGTPSFYGMSLPYSPHAFALVSPAFPQACAIPAIAFLQGADHGGRASWKAGQDRIHICLRFALSPLFTMSYTGQRGGLTSVRAIDDLSN